MLAASPPVRVIVPLPTKELIDLLRLSCRNSIVYERPTTRSGGKKISGEFFGKMARNDKRKSHVFVLMRDFLRGRRGWKFNNNKIITLKDWKSRVCGINQISVNLFYIIEFFIEHYARLI